MLKQTLVCIVYMLSNIKGAYTNGCSGYSSYTYTFTNITIVDNTTLIMCLGASRVNISHNRINILSNATFERHWNIHVLDLSFNDIADIPSGMMDTMRPLQELYITDNKLTALPPTFFYKKNNLKVVDISNNNISYLPLSIFNYSISQLEQVIIRNNSLTYVEPWANFNHQIKYIDVRYNDISSFTNNANWTYHGASIYDEALTDLRHNSFYYWNDTFFMQYKDPSRDVDIDTIMLEIAMDVRENNWMCDCKFYHFALRITESMYKWNNSELLNIKCYNPPKLRGKRVFFDIPLQQFVCNLTDNCPDGCLCQERPHDQVLNIDCRGQNLTTFPDVVPSSKYEKITMQLDDNNIARLKNVSYAHSIYSLTMSNNVLSSIDGPLIENIASKEKASIDFRNNELTRIPKEVQNVKYQYTNFTGNNLVCDCEMLWMKDWIKLAPRYVDRNLNCTFEGNFYKILDFDDSILKCSEVGSIVLIVVLTVVLFIVIALLVTAKKCPYETKVLLYKIFRIHPADKYVVDGSTDKEYDMFVSFDEDDPNVRQWVRRVLVKQLEEKKPHYSLSIAIRDRKAGAEADARSDLIENSRRLMIILSKGYANRRWCDYDACQAELLEDNQGRVLYVLYDTDAEVLVQKEPWMSKIKDRKVFTLGERMFWSKIRYELPSKPVRSNKRAII